LSMRHILIALTALSATLACIAVTGASALQ
jgi:hypothetical protein